MTRDFLERASVDPALNADSRRLAARLVEEHGRLRMDSEGHLYNTCIALGLDLIPVAPLLRAWRVETLKARSSSMEQ